MRAPLVRLRVPVAILAIVAGSTLTGASAPFAGAQQAAQPPVGVGQIPSTLPLANTIRERGTSVTPAFEGWYNDRDGSVRLLVGYYNRNTKQQFDIPPGPNNDIEPGGPDQGQPTHFQPGRQWGVFTIKVPKEFTGKLTWTLVTNGFTNTITMHTRPEWIVEPFEDAAQRNTPPVLKFQPDGASFTGPPSVIAAHYTAVAGEPLAITAWVTDEGPKRNIEPPATGRGAAAARTPLLALAWSMFRGPGAVTFEPDKPSIDAAANGRATTKATFSAAGDYILRLESTDSSGVGGGGFQCCWTNAHIAVNVKASATSR